MNIALTKIELAKQLLNTDNEALITYIKALFDTQSVDFWDEMPSEIVVSVKRSIKQADEGQLTSHTEVMKKYKKWEKK